MTVQSSGGGDNRSEGPGARSASDGAGVAASAVVGLVVGGLLWLAWEPTTRRCDTIGECLSAPIQAALLTLAAVVAVLVVRRVLRLRPVFSPTLLTFVGGGMVLLTIQSLGNIWPRDIHEPLAPWWSWLLVGGAFGALTHWAHQPQRRLLERVVPLVAVPALVTGGLTWVAVERDRRQLAELESVGLGTVVAPTFERFSVSYARKGHAEGAGDFVHVRVSPHDGPAPAWPDAYLVPVRDRDPCELAVQVTRREVSCVGTGGEVELTDDWLQGAGVVDGDTLLLVTGRVSPVRDDPDGWTQEALRAALDRRVPTTLEALRDGDVG